jgi:hypothetical protein
MDLRNEDTEAGKRIWRMVDEAAKRAPLWIQNNFTTQAEQHHTLPTQQQSERKDTAAETE